MKSNTVSMFHSKKKPEKLCAVVVALHAKLYKVPACLGTLSGPELHVDLSHCGLQTDLALAGRLLYVNIAHLQQEKHVAS